MIAGVAAAGDYSLTFSKTDRVLSWKQKAEYALPTQDRLSFSLVGNLDKRVSSTSKSTSKANSRSINTNVNYSLSKTISLGMNFRTTRSEQQSGSGTARVTSSNVSSTLGYKPLPSLSINQSLGRSFDERRTVSDAGLSYSASVSASPFKSALQNRGVKWSVSYRTDGVSSKQGDVSQSLSSSVSHKVFDRIDTQLSFSESLKGTQYVSARDVSRILRRDTKSIRFSGSAKGQIPGLADLNASFSRTGTAIDDSASDDPDDFKYLTNSNSDNWSLNTGLKGLWSGPVPLKTTVQYSHGSRVAVPNPSNRDSINVLDTETRKLTWTVNSGLGMMGDDSLRATISLAIDKRHTPAAEEINDKDQFTRSWSLKYGHRFAHGVSINTSVAGSDAHEVYLDSLKSANNRWRRRLTISASVGSRFGPVGVSQSYTFVTNQENYDYDELNADSPKSRQTYRAKVKNTFKWRFTDAFTSRASYDLELKTRGSLFLSAVGDQPAGWHLQTNEIDHRASWGLTWTQVNGWQVAPTATYTWQGDYTPTSITWKFSEPGLRTRSIKNLSLSTRVNYSPTGEFMGGQNKLTFVWTRTIRWLTRSTSHRDVINLQFSHAL